jgi:ribosomal protein S27AE
MREVKCPNCGTTNQVTYNQQRKICKKCLEIFWAGVG